MNPENILLLPSLSLEKLNPFIEEFKAISCLIDAAYDQAAEANGFACKGCEQSCCETLFYHHTIIEYCLLRQGLMELSDSQRDEVVSLAGQACRHGRAADAAGTAYRIMCPLNAGGLCRLYSYRPMICRMHGIAHELTRPDGASLKGPGCHLFEKNCSHPNAVRFNRTPFYLKIADLEKRVRAAIGIQPKIKMTIAQMILASTHDTQVDNPCAPWT